LTFNDVKTVTIPNSSLASAFQNESIDMFIYSEPWISRIKALGKAKHFVAMGEKFPNFQIGVIVYGSKMYAGNNDLGNKFMIAYLKAVKQYNQGKTIGNLQIISKYTKLDLELLQNVCWTPFRNDGGINIKSIMQFQAWAKNKGYLDRKMNESEFFDDQFIETAVKTLDLELVN